MSEIKTNPYTQNMITRCAGRFLIDLPADFSISKERTYSDINNYEVSAERVNKTVFDIEMEDLEKNYKDDSKHRGETYYQKDKPYLKHIYPLRSANRDNRRGMIFDRNDSDGSSRMLEGHLWSNDVWITLKIKAIDVDDPRFADDKKRFSLTTDIYKKLEELQVLMDRMEGWDNIHPPIGTEKGSCYPNIFIRGEAGAFQEDATNVYYYKGDDKSDDFLSISIEYNSDIQATTTLLQRTNRISEFESMVAGGKILRKGVRDIHGIHAEEILTSGSGREKGKTDYVFTLIGNETIGNPQQPYFTITLKNADIISEKDALAIWDAIIPTIRPRPKAY